VLIVDLIHVAYAPLVTSSAAHSAIEIVYGKIPIKSEIYATNVSITAPKRA